MKYISGIVCNKNINRAVILKIVFKVKFGSLLQQMNANV